jgi:hypothetical protein
MRSQLALIDTASLDTPPVRGSVSGSRRVAHPNSAALHTAPGMSRFRLDDKTRAIGREGLAAARAALEEAAARRKAVDDVLTSERHAA